MKTIQVSRSGNQIIPFEASGVLGAVWSPAILSYDAANSTPCVNDLSGNGYLLDFIGSPVEDWLGSLPALRLQTTSDYMKIVNANLNITAEATIFLAFRTGSSELLSKSASVKLLYLDSTDSNRLHSPSLTLSSASLLNRVTILALVTDGTTTKVYIDGVLDTSVTGTILPTGTELRVGYNNGSNAKYSLCAVIPKKYSEADIIRISRQMLFLASNCGEWRSAAGATIDVTDANFGGVHYIYGNTGDISKPNGEATALTSLGMGYYYDTTNKLIYGPLPTKINGDLISDVNASNNKLYVLTDRGLNELSLDNQMRLSIGQQGYDKFSVSGNFFALAAASAVIKMTLLEPATGRTIAYTRKVSGSNYIHTYLKDGLQVETKTTANKFENPGTIEFPFAVNGNEFRIDPCNYIIDDLMINDAAYDNYQIRAWAKADVLKDNNVKTLIAGVLGFSNQIIYSTDDIVNNGVTTDPNLISLAQANNNPNHEIYYSET